MVNAYNGPAGGFGDALVVRQRIAIVRRRSRLEISRATISYVSSRNDPLVLSRHAGGRLRIVPVGSARYRRPGLTLDGSDLVLPLSLFSVREVKRACQSKDWEFAGLSRARWRVLFN